MTSSGKAGGQKKYAGPSSTLFIDLAPFNFYLLPKVKMAIKGKCFESVQDIETVITAQLNTGKTSTTASESGTNYGINVLEVTRSILHRFHGNVFCTLINF